MVLDIVYVFWVGALFSCVLFPGIRYGQGAAMALPIWGVYMEKVYADDELEVSDGPFPQPENLSIHTNCNTYGNAAEEDGEELPDELDF